MQSLRTTIIRMIRYDEILYPNHFKYPLYQKNRDLLGLCYFWCWIQIWIEWTRKFRSSPAEVFLRKGVLKICSKFTREHPCRSVISVKLLVRSKRSSATGFAKKINSKRKSLAIRTSEQVLMGFHTKKQQSLKVYHRIIFLKNFSKLTGKNQRRWRTLFSKVTGLGFHFSKKFSISGVFL